MTTVRSVLRSPVNNFLATVILLAAGILIFGGGRSIVEADEFPTFFLKAAKSMPRIGRRSGTFNDYFMKTISKNIPRIGRRGIYAAPASIDTTESWPWYPKRPTDLSKAGEDNLWTSENFARALEQSPELWEMMTTDEGVDKPTASGEVWQREKRTGSEPEVV